MNKEAIIKLYEIANPEDVRFIMNVGEGRVVNKVKHPDQEKKLEEDIRKFVYKNDVVQCTIADSDFDKIKNLIPRIEKVENVVNPPHTPVLRNNTSSAESPRRAAAPAMAPMARAPSTFVISVSTGKAPLYGSRLSAYLSIAPAAPPAPTHKNPVISLPHIDNVVVFSRLRLRHRTVSRISQDTVSHADIISLDPPFFQKCFSLFRVKHLSRTVDPAGPHSHCVSGVHQIPHN